jgi:acyl-CoA dehydrogenase
MADVAMLSLGGELKRREKLSGRFADALSHLYLASAVVKHHEDSGRLVSEQPIVEWALADSLYRIQQALLGICDNFPSRLTGRLMRRIVMPLGARLRPPPDRLGARVARRLQQPGEARDRLTAGLFFEATRDDPVGLNELCLHKVIAAEPIEEKLRRALRRTVAPHDFEAVIAAGLKQGVINDLEARTLREAMELTAAVIRVDEFGEHRGPAIEQQPAATAS